MTDPSKPNADSRASQPPGKAGPAQPEIKAVPSATEAKPLHEGSTWYSQPLGPESVRDPIVENPFRPDDSRYVKWQKATLKAEEDLCRLHSQFQIQIREPLDPHGPASLLLELCVGIFDIWAKRSCQFVSSKKELQQYDRWLFTFAAACFDIYKRSAGDPIPIIRYKPRPSLSLADILKAPQDPKLLQHDLQMRGLVPRPIETFFPQLQSSLVERVEFWKAEARGYLAAALDAHASVPIETVERKLANAARLQTRAEINAFVIKILSETGRKITRKNIWTVAGYRDATEFERFQGDRRVTKSASETFRRILNMDSATFIAALEKKEERKK